MLALWNPKIALLIEVETRGFSHSLNSFSLPAGVLAHLVRFGFGGKNVRLGLHATPGFSSCGLTSPSRTSCP